MKLPMKQQKTNKQGVRDLNSPGQSNPRKTIIECAHIYETVTVPVDATPGRQDNGARTTVSMKVRRCIGCGEQSF